MAQNLFPNIPCHEEKKLSFQQQFSRVVCNWECSGMLAPWVPFYPDEVCHSDLVCNCRGGEPVSLGWDLDKSFSDLSEILHWSVRAAAQIPAPAEASAPGSREPAYPPVSPGFVGTVCPVTSVLRWMEEWLVSLC